MIEPPDINVKFRPIVDVPNASVMLLVTLMSLTPLLLNDTAPVKEFKLCVKVIGLAPALKLDIPGTVKVPVCVIAPEAITVMLLPIDDAPRTKPMLFVMLTLLDPLLINDTAPVKAFNAWVKVIACPSALKLDVPGIINAPD